MKISKEDELVFVSVLLTHGGDPEPDEQQASDKYNEWWESIKDALDDRLENPNIGEEAYRYVEWLELKGLHYIEPEKGEA